jgi:hypothetical protein
MREGQEVFQFDNTDAADAMESLDRVLAALSSIRLHFAKDEPTIHNAVAAALITAGIPFEHERDLGPRNRIDFLTRTGIGIEVKKGKPYSEAVNRQLTRYANSDIVKAIVLVIERYQDVPEQVNGKPCRSIGLNKQWGLALK